MAGRPPAEKSFANMLRIAVSEKSEDGNGTRLREIAQKLVDCAVQGESWAIQQVADRLDGKPAQAIDADLRHSADDSIVGLLERIATNGTRIHD